MRNVFYAAWSNLDQHLLCCHPIVWTQRVHYVLAFFVPSLVLCTLYACLVPLRLESVPNTQAIFIWWATISGVAGFVWFLKSQNALRCANAPLRSGWFATRLLCVGLIASPGFITANIVHYRLYRNEISYTAESVIQSYTNICSCDHRNLELKRNKDVPWGLKWDFCQEVSIPRKDCEKDDWSHLIIRHSSLENREVVDLCLFASLGRLGIVSCAPDRLDMAEGVILGNNCTTVECVDSANRIREIQVNPWGPLRSVLPGRREHIGTLLACLYLAILGCALLHSTLTEILRLLAGTFILWITLSLVSILLESTIPVSLSLCAVFLIFILGFANVLRATIVGRRGSGLWSEISLPAVYLITPLIPLFFIGWRLRYGPPVGITSITDEVMDSTAEFAGVPVFAWMMAVSLVWTIAVVAVLEPLARRWAQFPR